MLLYTLEILGTAVFAITGALKAVKHELDILGIMVLATITGTGGGILRDLILGDTPPASFTDETFFIVSIASALLVFFLAPKIVKIWRIIRIGDAIGLGLFTAIGAAKGMTYELGTIGIMMTGAITATGGGAIRDILVNEIPLVIRKDFYATAAIIGSLILIGTETLNINGTASIMAVASITTGLRLMAMKMQLSLPRAGSLQDNY
jgi:uncharacterized membrane protein YeiH